jgi:hypothetical protein
MEVLQEALHEVEFQIAHSNSTDACSDALAMRPHPLEYNADPAILRLRELNYVSVGWVHTGCVITRLAESSPGWKVALDGNEGNPVGIHDSAVLQLIREEVCPRFILKRGTLI